MENLMITALPPAGEEGDTQLAILGQMLTEAWKVQTILEERTETGSKTAYDAYRQAWDRSEAIANRIEEVPAHGFTGLRVKALAAAWCRSGDLPVQFGPEAAADERLAAQIVNTLLNPIAH